MLREREREKRRGQEKVWRRRRNFYTDEAVEKFSIALGIPAVTSQYAAAYVQ